MPTTPVLALPYPALTAAPNGPADIQALAERLEALLGPSGSAAAWTPYSPTLRSYGADASLGNGSIDARYKMVAKTVTFEFRLKSAPATPTTTFGTGGAGINGLLPVTPRVRPQSFFVNINSGPGSHVTYVALDQGTWHDFLTGVTSNAGVTGAMPAGQDWVIRGTYEAA